jgi:hypothetical protein
MLRSLVVVAVGLAAGCSSSGGTGSSSSGAQCAPALGTPPSGCPETAAAEAAFAKVQSSCGVANTDVDASNPNNPTLTAAGNAKLCSTCECRTAVYAYRTLYATCADPDEQGNTALAKNMYGVASVCR